MQGYLHYLWLKQNTVQLLNFQNHICILNQIQKSIPIFFENQFNSSCVAHIYQWYFSHHTYDLFYFQKTKDMFHQTSYFRYGMDRIHSIITFISVLIWWWAIVLWYGLSNVFVFERFIFNWPIFLVNVWRIVLYSI